MIHTVDNRIHVIYPLNYNEEELQVLIYELKETIDFQQRNNKNPIEIYLDTDDIAISLLFYFKDLIEKNDNITLFLKETLYETVKYSFEESGIFNSNNLKVNQS